MIIASTNIISYLLLPTSYIDNEYDVSSSQVLSQS